VGDDDAPKPQRPSSIADLYREIDRLRRELEESERARERLKRDNERLKKELARHAVWPATGGTVLEGRDYAVSETARPPRRSTSRA